MIPLSIRSGASLQLRSVDDVRGVVVEFQSRAETHSSGCDDSDYVDGNGEHDRIIIIIIFIWCTTLIIV